ncbi:MAG TPA: type II toxin-antitoxin system prevent-host-death family antitoxin [Terriglobales bacterium]|nr:type II toxin-antitoxin system prevent-host-death family antitoxin [Terriglobales bacterium]
MKMGLQQANQNFSKLVRAIRAGQTVTLTDRGEPLAVVQPVAKRKPGGSEEDFETALDRMDREGLLVQRGRPGRLPSLDRKLVRLRGNKTTTEMIREDRDAR